MISGELATLLSGRYIEIPIYPLSFSEFLNVKGIESSSRKVDNAYDEFEKYGGFPSVVIAEESIKDTILSGIFDTIVLNDVALRAGVKDPTALKSIIRFLADNVGQLVNASRIVNTLKSEGVVTTVHTVNRYLDLLENGYLFYRAKQYDIRGREYLRTNGKYFIVDTGLRRNAVGRKDGNYSNRLENIVYIELLRRGYTVDVGKLDNKEIDFVARKLDETLYIQVAYELPANMHETDNLLNIKDNYKKIVVTGRYYETTQIDGIPIIYIVDWLLSN
ncbi:ATP-binding protein [Listeria seeligeri]|nr:ATP-binding protein [Listeria seeligeri]